MDGFHEKKWFVYLTDHHEGPFSLDDIKGKLSLGQVNSQNYVWSEGMKDWEPMPTVPAFKPLLDNDLSEPESGEQKDTIGEPSFLISQNVTLEPAFQSPQTTEKPFDESEPKNTESKNTLNNMPQEMLSTKTTSKHRFFKGIIILLIPVAFVTLITLGFFYSQGNFSSILKSPLAKEFLEKIPVLGKWISPLPPLDDVSPEDYEELKIATTAEPGSGGPKAAIALSRKDLTTPYFYLTSSLPDGAGFDYFIEGVPSTLLNHLGFSTNGHFALSKKLGKTNFIRSVDNQPIPRGEYQVYMVESEQQSDEVKKILSPLEPSPVSLPTNLPKGRKLIAKKSFFLGGAKDSVYEERLKDYHDKLKAKASAELDEIKQFTQTLDSQIQATTSEFTRLRKGKLTPIQQKAWSSFHSKWGTLDNQLGDNFQKWTPAMLENDLFYGKLYIMLKTIQGSL